MSLRQRRVELGLSQSQLAKALGITFQQIQKYENGTNRVSAGRLYAAAQSSARASGFAASMGYLQAHTQVT